MFFINLRKLDEKRNQDFYQTLDFFINALGLTRCKIAKKCGMNSSTLNPCKCQNNRWVSLGKFFKICDALGIKPQDFINKMEKINEERE